MVAIFTSRPSCSEKNEKNAETWLLIFLVHDAYNFSKAVDMLIHTTYLDNADNVDALQARQSEGCLSRTQLTEETKGLNEWNRIQYETACARRALVANTARQSRSALWMNFQKRVLQQVDLESSSGSEQHVATIEKFYPSCTKQSGARIFQTLLMRAHRSGGLHLAVVLGVFRAAQKVNKNKKCFGSRPALDALEKGCKF